MLSEGVLLPKEGGEREWWQGRVDGGAMIVSRVVALRRFGLEGALWEGVDSQ